MIHGIPRFVGDALLAICEKTATPRSLTVAILLRNGEWDQLACLSCDPRQYMTAEAYYSDVVVTDFLRKLESLPTSFDRPGAALKNFWVAERSCYRANERLSPFLYGSSDQSDGLIRDFLSRLRKKVTTILGPTPPSDLWGRFGPGATYADRGIASTVPHKMSSRPTLTTEAYPFLFPWIGSAWARACATSGKDPLFVRGNRFTTVPKDCRKDRGIAVEPSINVFFQLGLGSALRKRLRDSTGIDLDHAQDVHRRVACEASITGCLCTLDLSNASDTICENLVKLALPSAWHEVLSCLRSPFTNVNGKWTKLEKFSSMGNGYTFELETVLFLSIVSTVLEMNGVTPVYGENVFAFGDDLIFPGALYPEVKAVLSFLGLSVNEDKTFKDGWFRESCGGDFYKGAAVRPYYLKKDPCEPQQLISLANGIRRLGLQPASSHPLDRGLRIAWFRVLDALPAHIRRLRGPEALGDLVIHDDESRWVPLCRTRDSIRYLRVYRPARYRKVRWDGFDPEVILASAIYGTGGGYAGPKAGEMSGLIPRNSVTGYKIAWYPYS